MLREQLRLRTDHLLAQRARLPEEHQELLLHLYKHRLGSPSHPDTINQAFQETSYIDTCSSIA